MFILCKLLNTNTNYEKENYIFGENYEEHTYIEHTEKYHREVSVLK